MVMLSYMGEDKAGVGHTGPMVEITDEESGLTVSAKAGRGEDRVIVRLGVVVVGELRELAIRRGDTVSGVVRGMVVRGLREARRTR